MLGRTDRSLLGIWWWTVDRWLLMTAIMLMVIGTLMVMAASPPVATRISLPEFHFVWRQLVYLMPAAGAVFHSIAYDTAHDTHFIIARPMWCDWLDEPYPCVRR